MFLSTLSMTNSRLKDYLDLSVSLKREYLDPATLANAIAATSTCRGTALPTELPIGLIDEFANDMSRHSLWAAFLRKNELVAWWVSWVNIVLNLDHVARKGAGADFVKVGGT